MNIVIIDCFDTWEHRVNLLMKVLREEGHRVQVLISDYRHIEKCRRFDIKENFKFFTAEPYKKNISPARLHSHQQLGSDMFSWVEEHEESIDFLWVLAPPNIFIQDAVIIKQRHPHIRLIIDLIDLWPETMPIKAIKKTPIFHHWKRLRDMNLKYADVVVTECNLYKEVLSNVIEGLNVQTLYLAREDQKYVPHLNLPTDSINLCYLGSINHIIDIGTIGEIVREIRKKKPVKLIIIGDGEKKYELGRVAESAGAIVDYQGTVYDRARKQEIFDTCHYGLNIMKSSVCVGLTMKSIDYFEFGLPIINNIRGDTWEAIEKYACGVNFKNKRLFLNDEENKDMRENSRKFFESNLTEKIFKRNLLKNIMNPVD